MGLLVPACNGSSSGSGMGDFSKLCHPCQANGDCGGGVCTQDVTGVGVCATHCGSASDCPFGYACYQIAGTNNQIFGAACLPANNVACSASLGQDGGSRNDAGSTGMNGNDAGTNPPDSGNPTPFPTCTTDGWASWASGFVQTNCIRCHADYSYTKVESLSVSIRSDVQSGRMPTDTTLQSMDISRFTRWIDCDMPP
jgi:hypothetical protein